MPLQRSSSIKFISYGFQAAKLRQMQAGKAIFRNALRFSRSQIAPSGIIISGVNDYICMLYPNPVKKLPSNAYPKMLKMKKTTGGLLLPAFLLFSLSVSAQFRKYSNEFLNIGAGARGLAMGSAQVASVQDGTSGYWNPAGLTV
jgi:hypothetical protein